MRDFNQSPKARFVLDRGNKKLLGVCAGLAAYSGFDTTLVRIAFVLGALLGFGSALIVYLVLALVAD
ncbi:PspC domain-containing protein [Novosphingobium umbonatum]|uniref:PspC domain-containing protein n=1 Tax=Novosphingobium umbonatum TaxID=1908524 RepID=A0A437N069_9SPHN|nr:PspC domain-containing protein [Novosphingobium umbonatum]RVU03254.1 PspC domain-containing protein [Novosphingobium umbonatum]